MFRPPQLPKAINKAHDAQSYKGIPCFKWQEFDSKILIGSGSYGEVYRGSYQKQLFVVKVLNDAETKDFIKEVRFHNNLKDPNLVGFKAMCLSNKAIMLEYVCFDLQMFGGDGKVSSLDALLKELHNARCKGFEHLIPCIAKHIVKDLSYPSRPKTCQCACEQPASYWPAPHPSKRQVDKQSMCRQTF
eukprot:Seg492.9 transcript_id=Seg492.9/GoldUCD/mRNA.D3Y31 product="Proto-oncogene tyrosine-protein kinase ROS" protein_id=Seg492.9/GoldUCD/D3Y31